MLIRCCDKSTEASSSVPGQPSLPNTFGEPPLMPIQPQVAEILYSRNNFVKKPLEDASGIGGTSRLLIYCCWENNHFSYANVSLGSLWNLVAGKTYYRIHFVLSYRFRLPKHCVFFLFRLHSLTLTNCDRIWTCCSAFWRWKILGKSTASRLPWRVSLTIAMDCLTSSSVPRTTTTREPISVSSAS